MVMLPYQKRFITNPSRVRIIRKSRRIGLSWGVAGDCALDASRKNGRNVYYIGFDKEMSSTFIADAAHWAKAYNLVSSEVEEIVIQDEEEDIIAYRIRFASGYSVTALSSKPRNIRSKEGRFVFDEFAFHDDPEGLLKAGIAVLMWGKSQIDIISSVNGACPFFEELCTTVAQERGYYVQTTTLDDALIDGLYERICFVNERRWTEEGEFAWRAQLIKEYGRDADEELFCKADTASKSLFDPEAVDRNAVGQWERPDFRRSYLVCVDPNFGAIGEDYWVVRVLDITSIPIKVVGGYRDNQHSVLYHRKQTLKIMDDYEPVLTAVESNSGGKIVAENLQADRPDAQIETVNTGILSKRVNTDRVALLVQQDEIIYPPDWIGISEMKRFSKLERCAISGNDDEVMCLATGMAYLELALENRKDISWIAS